MSPFTAYGHRNHQLQIRSIVVIVPAMAAVVVILIVVILVIVLVPILFSLTVFAFFVSRFRTAGTLTYYHPGCGTGTGPNYRSSLATYLAPDNRTGRTSYGASDGFV